MASVFLSYDREDAAAAGSVARALQKAGHSVWWDRQIAGGSEYSREIEQALAAAEAVVVLWSRRSVNSPWVRDEAASGRDRGRLVPVRLDSTDPPLGFRQYQTIDIPKGRVGKSKEQALLGAISAVAGTPVTPARKVRSPALERKHWILVAVILALLAGTGALILWRPWADRGDVVLAVGPAGTDAASQALARDLAIKLGALQTSAAHNVRLVEASDSRDADLRFEAAAAGPANATLLLKKGSDSSILWSRDFAHPSGKRQDLLQQLAHTAGRVTACATEGLVDPVPLKSDTLKTYLYACAQLSDIASSEPDVPVGALEAVIREAPRFKPAWAKLLVAESEFLTPQAIAGKTAAEARARMRGHIAGARKLGPGMPEISIAEASLLPRRDFAGRMALVSRAARLKPGDPVMMLFLSGILADTGRQYEAVDAAAKAVKLDPLSPVVHSKYTAILAYSGAFDAAKRELAKADRLWPGTASQWDAQFRFHYRYGDPRLARQLLEQQSDSAGGIRRAFLDVRENPQPEAIEGLLAGVRERLRNMENPSLGLGTAVLTFAHFDKTDDILSTLLSWPKPDDLAVMAEIYFRPEFLQVRRDPRFLLVAKRAGLLDYWLKSGRWPDFCSAPDQPYDCKAEAAKLS